MSDEQSGAGDEGEPEGGKRINGHRPKGMMPLAFAAALSSESALGEDLDFDVDAVLNGVTRLHAEIPADGYTAPMLGIEREGHGIILDDEGLVLTIGYLIMEAMAVSVEDSEGRMVPAEIVAYDYGSGFGLVRATRALNRPPLRIGVSAELSVSDPVLIVGSGGRTESIGAFVVAKREFAGYWEYLLDEAIFTSPPHANWGGTALVAQDGRLVGVGSLYVEDARPAPHNLPGNMFVPIDLLKPIFSEMMSQGRTAASRRPWLGMLSSETENGVEVVGLAPSGPAEQAGVKLGDVVVKVGASPIRSMADMYRKVWALGEAGIEVPLTLLRGSIALELPVVSEDRYQRLKLSHRY